MNKPRALVNYCDFSLAQKAYEVWKNTCVRYEHANGFARVIRPDTPDGRPNSTVSEGISYGMLLSVYHDDQELFDKLFLFSQVWLDHSGLMFWYIDPTGTEACPDRDDCMAATDADIDIAFALIMASKKWGGQGSLSKTYAAYAQIQIALVKHYEIDQDYIVKPGNFWGGRNALNLSYFAPAYFRVFGEFSRDQDFWQKVIDVNYAILFKTLNKKNGNHKNGLVPAWSNSKGEPVEAFKGALTYFQTDSIRTPFRLAQDYLWFGDKRGQQYCAMTTQFFEQVGPYKISDGFLLDGSHHPEVGPMMQSASAVYLGCIGVGAMAGGGSKDFIKACSEQVASLKLNIRSTYYQLSWSALSLLFMSGRFKVL